MDNKIEYVIGPDGSPLTVADLPSPDTTRWVSKRKALVVYAVQGGLISLEKASRIYNITSEEYLCWQKMINRHGQAGLKTTKTQRYRSSRKRNETMMIG